MTGVVRVGGSAYMTVKTWSEDELKIKVRVLDARHNYGRVDYKITPLGGTGEAWVQEDKLEATP